MKYLDEILTAKIIRQKEINTEITMLEINDTPNECEHGKIIKIAEEYQLIEFCRKRLTEIIYEILKMETVDFTHHI